MIKINKFNIDKLEFEKPRRTIKKYLSHITYENSPFNVQSDFFDIVKTEDNCVFIPKETKLYDLICKVELKIKEKCLENSDIWFKGAGIDYNFINQAFVGVAKTPELFKLKFSTGFTLFGEDNEKVSGGIDYLKTVDLENHYFKIILAVPFFSVNSHEIHFEPKISQIKIYCKEPEILPLENCQIGDSDSETEEIPEETEEIPEEIPEETEEIPEEIPEETEEIPEETEEIPEETEPPRKSLDDERVQIHFSAPQEPEPQVFVKSPEPMVKKKETTVSKHFF